MFEKDVIAIDINRECISMLIGNKFKINDGASIETPKGAFENGNIVDIQALAGVIGPQVKKAKTRDVCFVVRGQDIITRHMNIPMAKDEAMMDSVDFELRQFVGDKLDEYYFDYQIINYNKGDGTGKCDVIIVACEKRKIDAYMQLARSLRLNVKAIDLYANAIARVFANLKQSVTKGIKTVGIMNVDIDSSSFTISEWGKITIERYRNGGIAKAIGGSIDNIMQYNAILDRIDLTDVRQPEEESEIEHYFKGEVSEYNSLIQYYTSGKVKKNLDRIYVLGTATRIRGIEQYIAVNLNSRVVKAPVFTDLKTSVKAPKKIQLKDYIMPYGLLLRRE